MNALNHQTSTADRYGMALPAPRRRTKHGTNWYEESWLVTREREGFLTQQMSASSERLSSMSSRWLSKQGDSHFQCSKVSEGEGTTSAVLRKKRRVVSTAASCNPVRLAAGGWLRRLIHSFPFTRLQTEPLQPLHTQPSWYTDANFVISVKSATRSLFCQLTKCTLIN